MSTLVGRPTAQARGVQRRLAVIGLAVLLIAALGFLFSRMPALYNVPAEVRSESTNGLPPDDPRQEPQRHVARVRGMEVQSRFEEAVVMLHARRFEYAVASLHRVLELSPRMPEAHVNMGYALLGLGRPAAARDFFQGAIELNPRQANAYYGLAVAYERLADLPPALGAMRTYLHLAPPEATHRVKARSALWEWEAQLAGQRRAQSAAAGATPEGGGAP